MLKFNILKIVGYLVENVFKSRIDDVFIFKKIIFLLNV